MSVVMLPSEVEIEPTSSCRAFDEKFGRQHHSGDEGEADVPPLNREGHGLHAYSLAMQRMVTPVSTCWGDVPVDVYMRSAFCPVCCPVAALLKPWPAAWGPLWLRCSP